ncbi:MAG: DUF393 domain-containing protein [Planctomycetota bacterium]|nr:DUF393 domain-containing protein [Planctomycetota bacterium]MDA1177870.1 DUF393 domain-containing protein [Planctomycetota bacterium]
MATQPRPTHSLPSPSEHPDRIIVIYDGQCRFCRAGVEQLWHWDWWHKLSFISLHEAEVTRRWPQLTHAQLMEQMYIVTPDGACLGGASAVRFLARYLPILWPMAPWMHLPGTLPIWQFLYGIVARSRYRLAGRIAENCDEGTCSVHLGKHGSHAVGGQSIQKERLAQEAASKATQTMSQPPHD